MEEVLECILISSSFCILNVVNVKMILSIIGGFPWLSSGGRLPCRIFSREHQPSLYSTKAWWTTSAFPHSTTRKGSTKLLYRPAEKQLASYSP